MTDLVLVVALLAAVGAAWYLLRDLRTVPPGQEHQARRPQPASVSVVVPARDEATTLPALLASLRRLTVEVTDVLVVDDASRDATAAVAEAAGARVLPAGAPPPGWTGKAWACHVGAGAATGAQLLFLDADTVLRTDALAGLLELHERHGGLVSVQPFHSVVRPYEQLSAYFNAVSLLASGAFVRRPRGRPMAFGPCLLTSRTDYARAGGHAAVRGEILDDVALAAAYHHAGLSVRCVVGGRSIRMRSYPGGIRQLARGWTKNIASGASAAAPAPAVGTGLWMSVHHAVAVGAALAFASAVGGREHRATLGHLAVEVLAWIVVAAQLRSVLRRIGSFQWWTWALFPVPLILFDALFVVSAAQTLLRRSVRWRGREVELRRRRSAGEGA